MCKSTYSGPWQELSAAQRRRLADALRERGLHLTLQREAIYETVLGCPGHICAEHVLAVANASHPGLRMDKATVYRTLDLLVELGLVSEHECGNGPSQYEPASRGPHSHLLCERCGRLINLDGDIATEVRERLLARHGFIASLGSHPILGLCGNCQASGSSSWATSATRL